MDDAKRQKLMIGVLALAIIGAGGSYWFFIRDSGPSTKVSQTAPKERKKRERDTTADKTPKREGNRKVGQDPAADEERDEARGNRARKPAAPVEHKGNTKREQGPAKKKEKKNSPAV